LTVAADIHLEITRIMANVANGMEQGTILQWGRLKSDWGLHGEGTAEHS
jgi:hypothetical protein